MDAPTPDPEAPEAYRPGPFAVRDRILLYLNGVVADNVAGLELAAECLRRAGPGADYAGAMDALEQLLSERGGEPGVPSDRRLRSFPPFNRRTMVSEKRGTHSIISGVAGLVRRVLRGGRARLVDPAEREEGS